MTAMRSRLWFAAIALAARAQAPARPHFEVATVKLNTRCNGGGSMPAHGRFQMDCASPQALIEMAYAWLSDGGTLQPRLIDIVGAPAWVETDQYQINAKAEGDASLAQMGGPMLQALLEERFKLKIHRDTKQATAYLLTVAKGGPKLHATKEGSCVPVDVNHPPAPPEPGQSPPAFCGNMGFSNSRTESTIRAQGVTMEMFAGMALPRTLGRGTTVIDKTGLTGMFDIQLKFARDPGPDAARGTEAGATEPAGPSLFTALQEQLGLKLEQGKASVDILVIDHIERPADN